MSAAIATEDGIEMCSVRVGETLFGVPVMRILEILGQPATHPVPLAPEWIDGLAHYRGEVLTTVSLRRLLEMPRLETGGDVLVFEGQDGYFGLLVDKVSDVLVVSPADFEGNPSTLDDRRRALFAGTYKLKDGLLVLLDPERLDPIRLTGMEQEAG
ncbi:MAG: chemotaxis protein CheW [Acidobacterium ailaaui]|nr:chemotaxis protein CheW [Pseudacidobacterium ailaaui]